MTETTNTQRGRVDLVGAGPGDPELLTIKAMRALQQADVIIHDALVHHETMDWCRRTAQKIPIGTPRTEERLSQQTVIRLMIHHATEGKRVVRLKGGDPFVFGRGTEEGQALTRARIRWSAIPGLTSGTSVPAAHGIPLTHRGVASSVVFVTGTEAERGKPIDWEGLGRSCDTLVIFMGLARLPVLLERLLGSGRSPDTPVAVIERGTLPGSRIHEGVLGSFTQSFRGTEFVSPALLVVGDVVGVRWELEHRHEGEEIFDEVLSLVP